MLSIQMVREIRGQDAFSQSAFAELPGVRRGSLKCWERGDRELARAAKTLVKLISEEKRFSEYLINRSSKE